MNSHESKTIYEYVEDLIYKFPELEDDKTLQKITTMYNNLEDRYKEKNPEDFCEMCNV